MKRALAALAAWLVLTSCGNQDSHNPKTPRDQPPLPQGPTEPDPGPVPKRGAVYKIGDRAFHRVFVTSRDYTGDLGGVAGAHRKCQELGAGVDEQAGWVAWLFPGENISNYYRKHLSSAGYMQVYDPKVFTGDLEELVVSESGVEDLNQDQLLKGKTLLFSETGQPIEENPLVWSGIGPVTKPGSGEEYLDLRLPVLFGDSGSGVCGDLTTARSEWTESGSSDSPVIGSTGLVGQQAVIHDWGWTWNPVAEDLQQPCHIPRRLICFETARKGGVGDE